MRSLSRISFLFAAVVLAAGQTVAQEASHARIVRLSFSEGTVSVQRTGAAGFESAPVNTPIQQGYTLSTAQDSFAEVEFENSSTARVGQSSLLGFEKLALDANGGKLNYLTLQQGYATFNFIPEDGDVYQVTAGDATVTLSTNKETRFRADLDGSDLRIEVFKGAVDVGSPYGSERLTKNAVLEIHPHAEKPLLLAHGITKDSWDDWVDDRQEQSQVAFRNSPPSLYTNNVTDLLYGWNDLYYYGGWSNVPGYGNCWIPNVSYGWTPYSSGYWTFIPGYGYTWVSSEPWGWIPFHYGGWEFQPGFGWIWVPGGFNNWSPGVVTWYQGPGWVGWQPRPPYRKGGGTVAGTGGHRTDCPRGQVCTNVMSTDAFRQGLPVNGNRLNKVNVTQAFEVSQPDITAQGPLRLGFAGRPNVGGRGVSSPRAGSPATSGGREARAFEGGSANSAAQSAFKTAPGSAHGARVAASKTSGAVVYDPVEGRYVNGTSTEVAPLSRVSSKSSPAIAGAQSRASEVGAPAPVETMQAGNSGQVAPGRRMGAESIGHHASPQSGVFESPSQSIGQRVWRSFGFGNNSNGRSAPAMSSGSSSSSHSVWRSGSSGHSSSYSTGGSSPSSGSWSSGSSRGSSGGSSPSVSSGGGGGGGFSGGSFGGGGGSSQPSHSSGRPH